MIYALLAAALFSISTPVSKLLLAHVDPVALAGLLYLGAGGFAGTFAAGSRWIGRSGREAMLERGDIPWLAGAVVAGGVAAPLLLLFGLAGTPAATASLLLNFEAVATTLLAAALFREAIGRRTWWAVAAVTAGGIVLSLDPTARWGVSYGSLLVLSACLFWGLDNNLTRHISLRDPRRIVAVKGLVAGTFSLSLAAVLGRPLPSVGTAFAALGLGALSYGASIALFVRALREVGAARAGAAFGAAPFLAAALSLTLLPAEPRRTFFYGVPFMLIAFALLWGERHSHRHTHVASRHAHAHEHDEHHAHVHEVEPPSGTRHAHRHVHTALTHDHPHGPDVHHRHRHPRGE